MKIILGQIMYNKNLSVRQVSRMIGDIMNGKMPRMDTMEQLAAGLKVKISDLYESPYK